MIAYYTESYANRCNRHFAATLSMVFGLLRIFVYLHISPASQQARRIQSPEFDFPNPYCGAYGIELTFRLPTRSNEHGTYDYTGYVLFLNLDFMQIPLDIELLLSTANLAFPRILLGLGLLTHATPHTMWGLV